MQASTKKKVALISAVCVVAATALIFIATNLTNADNTKKIIECSTVDSLYELPEDTLLSNLNDTVYKVGDDYYKYFASTGAVQLVNRDAYTYSTESLDTINALYDSCLGDSAETISLSDKLTNTQLLNTVLSVRSDWLYEELDNCDANLLIDPDNVLYQAYRVQLENELQSILKYKTDVSKALTEVLSSVDVSQYDVEGVSTILDDLLESGVKDANYANTVTSLDADSINASISELQSALIAQQTLINNLQNNYDDLLVTKRVNLDEVATTTDDEDVQSLISYLDTKVDSYVSDCSEEYSNLSVKLAALEKLYAATTDDNAASEILTEYNTLKDQQDSIVSRITELESMTSTSHTNNVSDTLKTELEQQKAQLEQLSAVLDNSTIDDIENLSEKQKELYDYIKRVEEAYTLADSALTEDQIQELESIKGELEDSILESIFDTDIVSSAEFSSTISRLESMIDSLSDETKQALDAVSALKSSDSAQVVYVSGGSGSSSSTSSSDSSSSFGDSVTTLITSLSKDIEDNDTKIESVQATLVDLISETATDLQADILSELNANVTAQEAKLQETKDALQAIIDTTSQQNTEYYTTMQTELDKLSSETSESISSILEMLNSADGVNSDDIETAVNALDSKLSDSLTLLSETVSGHTTSISTLSDDIDTTSIDLSTLSTNTTEALQNIRLTMNSNNLSTTSDISSLKSSLTSLQSTTDTSVASLRSDLDDLSTTQLSTLRTSIATLQEDVSDLDSDTNDALTALASRVSQLESADTTQDGVNIALAAADDVLTAQIETISAKYDSIISQQEAAIATEKANIVVAYTAADAALENKLTEKIEKDDAALKDLIDTANADISALYADYVTADKSIYKVSTDLSTLTSLYTSYVADTNKAIADLNTALASQGTSSNGYTDAAFSNLSSIVSELQTDYNAYKVSTNIELNRLDQLISAIDSTTMSSDISTLKTSLAELKSGTKSSVATLDAKIDSEVSKLKTSLAENYAAVTASISSLDKRVTALEGLSTGYTSDISTLKTNLSTLTSTVTTLSSTVTDLATALDDKADKSDLDGLTSGDSDSSSSAYSLPIASSTTLGGVKVDNDTIYITSDGVLKVDLSTIQSSITGGTTSLGETISVGTVWSNYSDIPAAYRDYCIQANFVSLNSAPTMLYKEVEEEWYLYSIDYSSASIETVTSTAPTPTSAGSTYTKTYTCTSYKETQWYVTSTRPNKYKTVEKIPVTVYYYGFSDGLDGEVWIQYAVKHNISKTETRVTYTDYYSQTMKCVAHPYTITDSSGAVVGGGATYSWDNDGAPILTKSTTANTDKVWLNIWDDDTAYAKYGPDSDYVVKSYKGCYLGGCETTASQRLKLWNSGVLAAFYPLYYSTSDSNSQYYAQITHNITNLVAEYGTTVTVTNTDTISAMPENLNVYANVSTSAGGVSNPYNIFNFTEAGLAYKLAYLYGNHCWIYVGTP